MVANIKNAQYSTPRLAVYGSVRHLTCGSAGNCTDVASKTKLFNNGGNICGPQ